MAFDPTATSEQQSFLLFNNQANFALLDTNEGGINGLYEQLAYIHDGDAFGWTAKAFGGASNHNDWAAGGVGSDTLVGDIAGDLSCLDDPEKGLDGTTGSNDILYGGSARYLDIDGDLAPVLSRLIPADDGEDSTPPPFDDFDFGGFDTASFDLNSFHDYATDTRYDYAGDELIGGRDNDTVFGQLGNDTIDGGGGRDWLFGGRNADLMDGFFLGEDNIGDGYDVNGDWRQTDEEAQCYQGDAGDVMFGERGKDTMLGGNDSVAIAANYQERYDSFLGTAQSDSCYAWFDQWTWDGDWMSGGRGRDLMYGEAGFDTMYGNECNDTMYGGYHYDLMYGGRGSDLMYGGTDDSAAGGEDTADSVDPSGYCYDRCAYEGNYSADRWYDYNDGVGDNDQPPLGDTQPVQYRGGDTMYGGRGYDTMYGGAGDDLMYGGSQSDSMFGGDDDDRMLGQGHSDEMFGGNGWDDMSGGWGHDLMLGEDGNDWMKGDNGNDTMLGGDDDDVMHGNNGMDVMIGDSVDTEESFIDEDGHFTLVQTDSGNDTMYGEGDMDFMFGGEGDDCMYGGYSHNDMSDAVQLLSDSEAPTPDGRDYMQGNGGNDVMDGGEGADTMIGGEGDDVIYIGGGTADSWEIVAGDDVDTNFNVFTGWDEGSYAPIQGGGNDTFVYHMSYDAESNTAQGDSGWVGIADFEKSVFDEETGEWVGGDTLQLCFDEPVEFCCDSIDVNHPAFNNFENINRLILDGLSDPETSGQHAMRVYDNGTDTVIFFDDTLPEDFDSSDPESGNDEFIYLKGVTGGVGNGNAPFASLTDLWDAGYRIEIHNPDIAEHAPYYYQYEMEPCEIDCGCDVDPFADLVTVS